MWYINIIAASPIENRLVLKDKMEKSVSLKTETASTDKPNGNPLPGDKPLGLSQIPASTEYNTVIRMRRDKNQK